jgi:predicted PurR-regulated permease PerM
MLDKTKLRGGFKRLLRAMMPENVYNSTASFWSRCNKILIQYIAFDVMDGVIIGLLNWFFMVVMQMPYVAIISVIVGVTNLAPTFGPMVGAIIGAFILLLVVRHIYLQLFADFFPDFTSPSILPAVIAGVVLLVVVSVLNIIAVRRKVMSIWNRKES